MADEAISMDAVMHTVVRNYFRTRGLSKSLAMLDTAMKARTGRDAPLDLDALHNQRLPATGINTNTLDRQVESLMLDGVLETKIKHPKRRKSSSRGGGAGAAAGDGWSEAEVKKLKKAGRKYPSGKTAEDDKQRWEKVAKALGSSRSPAECKAKYRAMKKAASSSKGAGARGGADADAAQALNTTGPLDRESALQDLDDAGDDDDDGAEELIIDDSDSDGDDRGDGGGDGGKGKSKKKAKVPSKSGSGGGSRPKAKKKKKKSPTSASKPTVTRGFGVDEEVEPAAAAAAAASPSSSGSPKKDKKDKKRDRRSGNGKHKHKHQGKGKGGGKGGEEAAEEDEEGGGGEAGGAEEPTPTGGFFSGGGGSPKSGGGGGGGGNNDDDDEMDEFDLSGDEELDQLEGVGVPVGGGLVGGRGGGGGGGTVQKLSTKDKKALHALVFGNTVPYKSKTYFNSAWLRQGFAFSDCADLRYGLVQNEGGPCGPLACVQAHVLLHLLNAHPGVTGDGLSKAVTKDTQQEAVAAALTTILWRAASQSTAGDVGKGGTRAVVAMPADPKSHGDPLIEGLVLQSFTSRDALQAYMSSKEVKKVYCAVKGPGVALFVCSVALSRGLEAIQDDFDTAEGFGESAFLTSHFYASQLLVNLCLVGRAVPNIFDGEKTADEFLLRGIPARSDVGFLTLFEHHDYVQAGSHYKLPRHPVWVVCSESHYSTFFAAAADNTPLTEQLDGTFDLLYFDGLDGQDERICLTVKCDGEGHNVELEKEGGDAALVPPLNHCVRTCWPKASIHWNGSEPRL